MYIMPQKGDTMLKVMDKDQNFPIQKKFFWLGQLRLMEFQYESKYQSQYETNFTDASSSLNT